MNTNWIFSDETENFRSPAEPKAGEPFTIRLWADAQAPCTVSLFMERDGEAVCYALEKSGENGPFAVYEIRLGGVMRRASYYFLLQSEGDYIFYGRGGIAYDVSEVVPFALCPDYTVPAWARGAVWYQIFTDRFCNGDPSNDVRTG